MLALDHASMGAIVVVRNVAPLVSLTIEGFFGERVSLDALTILSLLYIVGGVVLYVSSDISFSVRGMGYMLVNMSASVPPHPPACLPHAIACSSPLPSSPLSYLDFSYTVACIIPPLLSSPLPLLSPPPPLPSSSFP